MEGGDINQRNAMKEVISKRVAGLQASYSEELYEVITGKATEVRRIADAFPQVVGWDQVITETLTF